jgi:hypothetical protein
LFVVSFVNFHRKIFIQSETVVTFSISFTRILERSRTLEAGVKIVVLFIYYTGYFTNDNEPGGIENATHNTFPKLT